MMLWVFFFSAALCPAGIPPFEAHKEAQLGACKETGKLAAVLKSGKEAGQFH